MILPEREFGNLVLSLVSLVRYWGPNEDFVLVRALSSGKLQPDRGD